MTLESDAKFEEKLTFGLENNIINSTNFYWSTGKLGLKIEKIEKLTMKKDEKFEKELTSSKLTLRIYQNLT